MLALSYASKKYGSPPSRSIWIVIAQNPELTYVISVCVISWLRILIPATNIDNKNSQFSMSCSSSASPCPYIVKKRPSSPQCFPFLRSLKGEVKDRNQISPHHSPVCKIEMSLSLEIRWNSDGVVQLQTQTVCVCVGGMVSVLRRNMGSPREQEVSLATSFWCLHYI